MAYERESIAHDHPQQSNIPVMREERVYDPYQKKRPDVPRGTESNQPVTSEAASTEVPKPDAPPAAESVTLSPAAAALARKEQKFRQQQQDLKEKEAALEAERKEIAELKAIKAKLANKDFSGVEELLPYDQYTDYLINKQSKLTPDQQTIAELRAKVDGVEKAHKDDVSARFEAAVQDRRKAVTDLVAKDESYSSIKELNQQEAVVQHILDTWEHDNIDLDVETAAREVEEILVEQANKWAALTKIKPKAPKEEPTDKELPPLKPKVTTLANNMAATGEIKRPTKSFQGMSDTERYAEARRRAEEKLKQQPRP